MVDRFIPDAAGEFRDMAVAFLSNVTKNPELYLVSENDLVLLTRAVKGFEEAYSASQNPRTRGKHATTLKNERRREAKRIIERISAVIRASDKISPADKCVLGIYERSRKMTKGKCPIYPPVLAFEGILAEGAGALHQLRVTPGKDYQGQGTREGAVRIELFADLVGPGEEIPNYPGEFMSGRPFYLGSFNKSPIRVAPPIPPVPMLVVYWVRWVDSSQRPGPFSKTCESRWEGRRVSSQPTLGEMPTVRQLENDPKQITVIKQFRERYLEGVRVEQRAIEDARGEVKQLSEAEARDAA